MAIRPEDLDDFTNAQLRYLIQIWNNDQDDELIEVARRELNHRHQKVYRQLNPIQSVVRKRIVNRVDRLKPKRYNGGKLPVRSESEYLLGGYRYHQAVSNQAVQIHMGSRHRCEICHPIEYDETMGR